MKNSKDTHDTTKGEKPAESAGSSTAPPNFIRAIIDEDMKTGRWGGRVMTRFPPEPNGYLHMGHAKSICLNFGLAADYGGLCNLRFDDTDPAKESVEYVESIKADVRWLGFDWDDRQYAASDYFEQLYAYAVQLIQEGKAYVDSLSAEEIRQYRGTLTEAGRESPYRQRSVEENLDLYTRMRAGDFEDGSHVLRAKIDMASPNLLMRDPTLYRIKHVHHYRTGENGVSTPCTILRIASPTPSRESPTRSAPWSSKTTGSSTTGCWTGSRSTIPGKSNLRV